MLRTQHRFSSVPFELLVTAVAFLVDLVIHCHAALNVLVITSVVRETVREV